MINEVDPWQIMAYRISCAIVKETGVKLTYKLFKSIEKELRLINEQLICKIYFGIITAEEEDEVLHAMRQLMDEHLGEPLNSGIKY